MIDEDLDGLIGVLSHANPDAPVGMPGAICSAGELLSILLQARAHRERFTEATRVAGLAS